MPLEGLLCLLWDVPERERKRVVKRLQERSLIEFENNLFWLHPIIKIAASDQLNNIERKETNNQAALFWISKNQSQDLPTKILESVEAYYHYFDISEYETAAKLLLQKSFHSKAYASTATFLSYHGSAQKSIYLLRGLINLPFNRSLSDSTRIKLKICLSHILRTAGKVQDSIEILVEVSDYLDSQRNDKVLRLDGQAEVLFFLGLSFQDPWMCVEAELYYKEFLKSSASSPRQINLALCNLIEMNTFMEKAEKTLDYAEALDAFLLDYPNHECRKTGFIEYSQGLLKYSKKDFEAANSLYRKAIYRCKVIQESCNYNSVNPYWEIASYRGLALSLSSQSRYREAIEFHRESVERWHTLNHRVFEGEALMAYGITLSKMGDISTSYIQFNQAIEIFEELQLPWQIKRVKKAMQQAQ